tara:strand:- start:2902 stop:3297 length:396 start_codon:yes stop_codon:yes gene_type:complete
MKQIQMKNEKGELIGLVLEPENGDNISSDNIKKIIPHIKNESFTKNMNNIQICDGLISFNNQINESDMKEIINFCVDNLSEKIIVEQNMGWGPNIRHRPLYFGLNKEKNSIKLKFTELGDFNSIDVAINEL